MSKNIFNRRALLFLTGLSVITSITFFIFNHDNYRFKEDSVSSEFEEAAAAYLTDEAAIAQERTTRHAVVKGSTLSQSLRDAGLEPKEIHALISATEDHLDPKRIRPGLAFTLYWQDVPIVLIKRVVFQLSSSSQLEVTQESPEVWKAELINLPIEKIHENFLGTVNTNLWDSAIESGMDANLISDLAEVFAWQIDFNRELRPGDRWRLVVEKLMVEGKQIGWGNILAAEYQNHSDLYTAVRYPNDGPSGAYFSPDGQSMRRMFLKSPIKFGRISSKFRSARFHPILKRKMPHNGVDYAAPPGTPIMAVGDGVIDLAGYNGGSGLMVKLRHNAVYTTAYLHMRALARGIHKGKKVSQGEVIGYVGSTGLATGPHLHFAFYESNVFVDPLGKKFPSADPVPSKEMDLFDDVVAKMLKALPSWTIAEASNDRTLSY